MWLTNPHTGSSLSFYGEISSATVPLNMAITYSTWVGLAAMREGKGGRMTVVCWRHGREGRRDTRSWTPTCESLRPRGSCPIGVAAASVHCDICHDTSSSHDSLTVHAGGIDADIAGGSSSVGVQKTCCSPIGVSHRVSVTNAPTSNSGGTSLSPNRGRQVVASFFTKDMAMDWRLGAEHFEEYLLDYDPSSNWGNWNYVAGVGSDPREDRYFNVRGSILLHGVCRNFGDVDFGQSADLTDETRTR